MKKVIIIGAGNIGKAAFEFVGAELVECFADNGKKGNEFLGKKIVSVDSLATLKDRFILLLAMIDCVNELMEQLDALKIEHYFWFGGNIYFFGGLRQWNRRRAYEENTLWDYYVNFGLENAIIIGEENTYAKFLAELFGIEIVTEAMFNPEGAGAGRYLLNMDKVQSSNFVKKHSEIAEKNIFVMPQLDGNGMKDAYEELKVFEKRYKGKRCFIIGNGPSLRIADLEKLDANNEICFGLNVIHKFYGQTKWRPDYVCMTDPLVIAQNYEAVKENNTCPRIVNDIKLFYQWEMDEDEYLVREMTGKVGFSTDFSRGFYNGATVTYAVLQLCAYMGFEKIYLLGMDCSSWGKHFSEDYWQEGERYRGPDEIKIFKAYQIARQYAEEHGFTIYNATRGGNLEVYERVDFDSLF